MVTVTNIRIVHLNGISYKVAIGRDVWWTCLLAGLVKEVKKICNAIVPHRVEWLLIQHYFSRSVYHIYWLHLWIIKIRRILMVFNEYQNWSTLKGWTVCFERNNSWLDSAQWTLFNDGIATQKTNHNAGAIVMYMWVQPQSTFIFSLIAATFRSFEGAWQCLTSLTPLQLLLYSILKKGYIHYIRLPHSEACAVVYMYRGDSHFILFN